MALFDRHSNWTRAIIEYFLSLLSQIILNNEEANYLVDKINSRREF